jgi:hypothetical protein
MKLYGQSPWMRENIQNCILLLKETVSRDFLPLVFFVKHLPLGHCFTPLSAFANNFEFTEIFKLKVDSAVSLTPLSQKNFLRQPPFFKLLPQRSRVGKFTLAWILLDCILKENESL